MNRKSGSGSGPFLMEMLVAVGFFMVCSAICVTVFVKADRISRHAWDMNRAVEKAQSLAEELKAGEKPSWSQMLPDRGIWKYLPDRENKEQDDWNKELVDSPGYEGIFTVYWDKDWQPEEPSSSPPYLGIIFWGTAEGLRRADIIIMCYGNNSDKGRVLYRLQTETYEIPVIPRDRKGEADGTDTQK